MARKEHVTNNMVSVSLSIFSFGSSDHELQKSIRFHSASKYNHSLALFLMKDLTKDIEGKLCTSLSGEKFASNSLSRLIDNYPSGTKEG